MAHLEPKLAGDLLDCQQPRLTSKALYSFSVASWAPGASCQHFKVPSKNQL